jgi:hypothetical protein
MPLLPTDHPVNLDLNLLIPDADFGLLMIYYQKFTAGSNASVSWGTNNNVSLYNDICPNSTTCAKKSTLSCPYSNTSAWGAKEGTLREGINILKINASDTLTIKSNGNNKATVTFGTLSLIPAENPTNSKLCYKYTGEKEIYTPIDIYDQILADIRCIDNTKEFYYNLPIEQHLDIDMTPTDEKDTLENPLSWFNYNNINNAFVISEIDTEHLTEDIVIAKSSRSNY